MFLILLHGDYQKDRKGAQHSLSAFPFNSLPLPPHPLLPTPTHQEWIPPWTEDTFSRHLQ